MQYRKKPGSGAFIFSLALLILLSLAAGVSEPGLPCAGAQQTSDHFDGNLFFNPAIQSPSPSSGTHQANRGIFWYAWHWLINNDRPAWPEIENFPPGPPPALHAAKGAIRITPIGHSTFLIQMDGLNILTDPIWSNRCSPVSWAGPRRHKPPGILLQDLPPIDAVLISHNHYDHLDLPTLRRLAGIGTRRALVTLGNLELVRDAGIPAVTELDWWQKIPLSPDVTVTLVPAQHFSSRTLWDRNKTLWGGFVVSGPSGNIYYAGDTGYGPHFREIARRFSPIRAALLPISPFRPEQPKAVNPPQFSAVHMGPKEAIQAHIDLGASLSIAAHFQVFQLGWDGFEDAVSELASTLKKRDLMPHAFLAPTPGQAIELHTALAGGKGDTLSMEASFLRR